MTIEYYALPGLLPEDIQQEMELGKLTGHRVSRKRLMDEKDLGYGLQPDPSAVPLWSIVPRPDYSVIEKLAEWVMQQEEDIKREVYSYLAQPDSNKLVSVIQLLGNEQCDWLGKTPKFTLTHFILNALPATMDELIEMGRDIHHSKKPDAAVRQNIRNLVKRKQAEWKEGILCPVGDSVKQTNNSSVTQENW